MKYIDLFAGIGGFRLALDKLGHDCVFSSEFNRDCQKVYLKNFKETPYGDINQLEIDKIPEFDILTAGFPCQPFSFCGLKKGFLDESRGTLFFNIANIIKQKKPKMFVLENVKGIVTHDRGNTLDTIFKTLDKLGYTLYSKVINTYDFGIPQYRERWFCVGFLKPVGFEFPIGNNPGTKIEKILEKNNTDPNLSLPQEEIDRINYHFQNYKTNKRVKHSNKHSNPKSKIGKFGIYSYLKPDKSLRFHTGDQAKSQIQDDYYVSKNSVSPTLIATRAPKLWDLKRHMSVLECKRLQSFPDNFDFSEVSIKVAKKQLGNAVTVKVVKEIVSNMIFSFKNQTKTKSNFYANRFLGNNSQNFLF